MPFITALWTRRPARLVILTGYYFAIIVVLFALATAQAFTTPNFVYQGF